jgi:hypothetical protein
LLELTVVVLHSLRVCGRQDGGLLHRESRGRQEAIRSFYLFILLGSMLLLLGLLKRARIVVLNFQNFNNVVLGPKGYCHLLL